MTAVTAIPDVNVLFALVSDQHVHHGAAHRWFATVAMWATTPFTEAALVRLILNAAVAGGSHSTAVALQILCGLRALPGHRFLPDEASLAQPHIALTALVGHRQVTDFHLVNLAAASGAVLATFDARLAASLAPADRGHVVVIGV